VEAEEPLAGGMDASHTVVRVGDTVRRPVTPSSTAVRALLLHLEAVGFDGAPRYLGLDEQGRDVVSYLDGDVPLPPYPAWSMTEDALVSLGHLTRRLHEATESMDRRGVDGWAGYWSDPRGGRVICHNDLFPENVVFRDGRVVAFIDFDMAAPGRVWWDLAIAGQEWAPLHAPDARVDHPRHLDGVTRFGRFARAYGVRPEQASDLVDIVFAERAHSIAHIRAEIAAGNPAWIEHWRATDGDERARLDDQWLARQRSALIDAITG
jgi:Ser/Thr protein kinase RdoA (MazF antagonist)